MAAPIINADLHGLFRDEEAYRYHPKVRRIEPGDNLGTTILVLREL
jgi:hypothetical protein